MLEKMLWIGRLFDYYGGLLTPRQQNCVRMHYLEDLSLGEIADEFGVSRQAVHDILNRAVQTLEAYEKKLGLVARRKREQELLRQILAALDSLPAACSQQPRLLAAQAAIRSLLAEERMAE
ncbi:MAG: YlxM family DNA-binding protein [Sporomusaceae bacterium]|nr:YlxM family DNA-binding protein [Sporomusaceae bacterium]